MTAFYVKRVPLYVTMAWDPALTDKETSDANGFTVVGTDPEDNWWILEAEAYKAKHMDALRRAVYWCLKYQPAVLSLEAIAAQRVFKDMLLPEFEKNGIATRIELYTESNRQGKLVRIESMEPRFRNGQVYIRRDLDDLIHDLDEYPEIDHFDILDSLAQHMIYSRPADPHELAMLYQDEESFDDEEDPSSERDKLNGSWVGRGTPRRRFNVTSN